jgi:hypothetical protein
MAWINQIESIANHLHMGDRTCMPDISLISCGCDITAVHNIRCNQQDNHSSNNYMCPSNSSNVVPDSHTSKYISLFSRLPHIAWDMLCKQYSSTISPAIDIK